MPRRPPNVRMVQNFHLVWLDGSIDEVNDDDCRNSILSLQQVVNTVNTFIDADACIDFITDHKEKALMIVSEELSRTIIPIVQNISQVHCVYIFCKNNISYEKLAKEKPKVKGAFTDITTICEELKQTVQNYDHNSISVSFVEMNDGTLNHNLDQLDQSFMYTQILKEILLTIDFKQVHFNEFITYCRERFSDNSAQLKNINMIEKKYRRHPPIWWYTSQPILYSMLNRALRFMEVDLIVKMGFFVRDLHNHIATLHSQQYGEKGHSNSFIVYRGQVLSQIDFNQIKKTQGGLMSFNNFLSTSLEREVSLAFAESNPNDPNQTGVLFEITINPSLSSISFAKVESVSHFQEEEEILFSMHSVFRIGKLEQINENDRLWQVDLTLTSDNDPQLEALTKSMQEETDGETGWYRLGKLMIKVGQFDSTQQMFDTMLDQATDEIEIGNIYVHFGLIKMEQGRHAEALSYYEKALEIRQKTLPANHPALATSYNNIGGVYSNMGEYLKALSYYEKALEILRKTLPVNHPHLTTPYHNIGEVYDNMGEYSKALSYYEKALEIRRKTLPANHPDLAGSYSNIGGVYYSMGAYSKALSYYEKTLEIWRKTLPANHPDLANSYNNIGSVYDKMGEYSKALSYCEKSLEIRQKTLPANHPDLATSYNNIGSVYDKMGEYSEALSCYEKALEILQKTLPANHPHLAQSYNNVGLVYYNLGEYSKALSYYEKAFEIWRKTLPANHPDLATSYNNIGVVYRSMSKYTKAASYYEKALEIKQKTLPANHPSLATSYNNIGEVYCIMGDYTKTLSYYEKALEVLRKTLPANHPHLAGSYTNIGGVYYSMGAYSKALSYLECGLDIWQRSLPPNHLHLQMAKKSIEIVKKKL